MHVVLTLQTEKNISQMKYNITCRTPTVLSVHMLRTFQKNGVPHF